MNPAASSPSRRFRFHRFARAAFRRLSSFAAVALACGAVSTLCAGCASAYWRDRANDLGDIASVSFGAGLGVRAQAGPVATGLGAQMDVAGFRGGHFFADRRAFDLEPLGWSVDLVCASANLFGLRPADGTQAPFEPDVDARGKYRGQYNGCIEGAFIPFWLFGEQLHPDGMVDALPPYPVAPGRAAPEDHWSPDWTHLEIAAALGVGVRLGFNPGELLDFLLGFFGADLYGDDLARGEEENPHAESAENAEPESHAESAEFAEH
ncbi:MAG: hypothetical protein IJL06_09875 [Kiritimatiellae bacterium]|nr:hypothetical protein [Kiritimatiellia bacterium]